MVFRVKPKGDVPPEVRDEIVRFGPTFSPVHDIFTNALPRLGNFRRSVKT